MFMNLPVLCDVIIINNERETKKARLMFNKIILQ